MSVKRRLLIVANPYPPMVSAGTTRVVRFLRHLPEHDWDVTVLTANGQGDAPLPPKVRVLRAPVPMPRRLLGGGRRSTKINRWVSVPDPYFGWVGPALYMGVDLLRREPFDVLFSSSPRPSVHLVGAGLAKLTGLPWLADYRDPWSTSEFRTSPTPLHTRAHHALEAHALRHAAGVSAVTQPMLDDVVRRHPWLADRAFLLPNGFDRDEVPERVDLGPGFWLVHTGRLYGREPEVRSFLTALASLPADVKALFVGVGKDRVMPEAERLGLRGRVYVEPFVPHARALGYQRAADALVLVNGRASMVASSKVYEYLQAEKPVFSICPERSAAWDLLAEVGGGTCVSSDEDMARPLSRFITAVREGRAPQVDPVLLERYEVHRVTAQLAVILDGLADEGAASARTCRRLAGSPAAVRMQA
jgi:glycosyltransferase involved in cell wall biosynthesis